MNPLEEELEKYPNPKQDYMSYYLQIAEYNLKIQEHLRQLFEKYNDVISKAITVVGSDARLEKGYKSKVEIRVIKDKKDRGRIDISEFKQVFSDIEVKDINKVTFTYNDYDNRIFPSRAIDSRFVVGNFKLFERQKDQFIEECSEYYKKLKKILSSRIKYYKQILRTGKAKFGSEMIEHYDLENNTVFYDNKKHLGFKAGPLRVIQMKLVKELIKYFSDKKDNNFLKQMPSQTTYRILYFSNIAKKLRKIGDEINDNYMFFLKEYHINQYFQRSREKAEIKYTDNKFQEIKERLKAVDMLTKDKWYE